MAADWFICTDEDWDAEEAAASGVVEITFLDGPAL
jgi:hypothetical protein